MNVIKRSGEEVSFDADKILLAIEKANQATQENRQISEDKITEITNRVIQKCNEIARSISVEEIQDLVENELMAEGAYTVAHNYITYRYERALVRKANTTDKKILSLLGRNNEEAMQENSNKNPTVNSTQRDYMAGEVSKDITRRFLLPKEIWDAHEKGIIHFHDSDYFAQPMYNCCLVNLEDMLQNGTVISGTHIDKPHSFATACNIATQIIAQVASNQYGGQTITLSHLAPFVDISRQKYRKSVKAEMEAAGVEISEDKINTIAEERVKREVTTGVQTIQYQIITLMTTNGQAPFVTVFMYLDEVAEGQTRDDLALIIEEMLKQRMQGVKNEKGVYITPAFPKLVYVLDEHNALKGGKYDYLTELAIKCSTKRMYPDYISAKQMRENYEGNVFSPMGCRSFLSPWKDENGNYKFEGRFNQGVVSINLPQIGIIADGDEEVFWKLFDERLDLCFEALMCRHRALLGTLSDVSPIHWQYGAIARLEKGEKIDKFLKGGYSTISLGYIGLYELTKLMKGVSHTQKEGEEFALRVMNHLRETCDKWKKETGIGFGLYGTPAESLCYRFARIDKERFGTIKDVTDKGFYTNSYHVDVREKIDAFSKLKFESQFQKISNGGCISYVEIPNMSHNLEAMRELVKYIYENLQYAEFNTKSDYCQVCGYTGEIKINDNLEWECPECGNKDKNKMNVTRRTCGYLGENFWNEGKTKEIKARALHL